MITVHRKNFIEKFKIVNRFHKGDIDKNPLIVIRDGEMFIESYWFKKYGGMQYEAICSFCLGKLHSIENTYFELPNNFFNYVTKLKSDTFDLIVTKQNQIGVFGDGHQLFFDISETIDVYKIIHEKYRGNLIKTKIIQKEELNKIHRASMFTGDGYASSMDRLLGEPYRQRILFWDNHIYTRSSFLLYRNEFDNTHEFEISSEIASKLNIFTKYDNIIWRLYEGYIDLCVDDLTLSIFNHGMYFNVNNKSFFREDIENHVNFIKDVDADFIMENPKDAILKVRDCDKTQLLRVAEGKLYYTEYDFVNNTNDFLKTEITIKNNIKIDGVVLGADGFGKIPETVDKVCFKVRRDATTIYTYWNDNKECIFTIGANK